MQLNFVAKHQEGESVACLLIRQAEGLYLSPGELLARLGSKCNPNTELVALLRGNKGVLKDIWAKSNWAPSALYKEIAKSRDFSQWVNYNHTGVCPKCATAGIIPESHDFTLMSACTQHSILLARECQVCSKPISVNRYKLAHCRCGEPIRSEKASESHVEQSRLFESLIKSHELTSLYAFKELQSIMARLNDDTPTSVYRDFLEGELTPLAERVSQASKHFPDISLRCLCALFACAKSDSIKLAAPRILSKLKRLHSHDRSRECPKGFYLTNAEFRYALGLKQKTAVSIEQSHFQINQTRGRSTAYFTYEQLSGFFSPLLNNSPHPAVNNASLATLSVTTKTTIDELLRKLGRDELKIHSYDDKMPLSQIRVLNDPSLSENMPSGFMTMDAVVAHLDSYEEAIRGVRDAGLLPYTHQKSCNNRYLFATKDVDAFHSKYVLIGELARELQYPPMRLSDRLRELGVVPVAGPYEGNSSVSTFKRSDIEDVDLRAAIVITNYATNSGRNAGGTPSFDAETWATGHEVAAELNVPIAQLHRITQHNLLVKGTPRIRGSQRRHYYRRDSIKNVIALLTNAVEVDQLAKELKANRKKLISRYLYLLKAEPIEVGNKTLIPIDDAKQLRAHYEQFKDASAAADYLSTTRHQIGNWKKATKLSPIPKDDPNFIKSPHLYRLSDLDGMRNSQQLLTESQT